MQTDFVAVPPFWTVGQTIDHMRDATELPDSFSDIFVVDPTYHVIGSVDLSRILRSRRDVVIESIMDKDRHVMLATEDQEEVARQFERHELRSAPVVDADRRLVGVVTVDDVVEVIEDGADNCGACPASATSASATACARSCLRASGGCWWTLITAILASAVIKQFDATIEHMVALAVLMPIVASMGGNAGTQTMTVAVRALATGELGAFNTARVVVRETAAGLVNGVVFAGHHGGDRVLLVRLQPARRRDRRGDGDQPAGGRARRHLHPAGAGKAGLRSGRLLHGLRDHRDGRRGLPRLPRPRDAVADVERVHAARNSRTASSHSKR